MISIPKFEPGTWRYKAAAFFVNKLNFCEGYYYDTDTPKPENKLYTWFYTHWLWPFHQNDCLCCNTVRGLIYGAVLGYLIGRIIA